jgi:4'-phosphopantetheinyl transferase
MANVVQMEFELMKPDPAPRWPAPPPLPRLESREVHIWAAALDVVPAELEPLTATLSATERERAARFHFERHRNRFIAGRGWLRATLGHYLRTDPGALDFTYGANGKPALGGAFARASWHFNLAHSGPMALLAITRLGEVGVDIEEVRPLPDAEELVARFFSARETALFRELPEDQKPAAFFNLWTRKEAWLKATGEGIAQSLHLVEVSFLPGEPARLLGVPEAFATGPVWNLCELAPAYGFAAALALAGEAPVLRCWSSLPGTWLNQKG